VGHVGAWDFGLVCGKVAQELNGAGVLAETQEIQAAKFKAKGKNGEPKVGATLNQEGGEKWGGLSNYPADKEKVGRKGEKRWGGGQITARKNLRRGSEGGGKRFFFQSEAAAGTKGGS